MMEPQEQRGFVPSDELPNSTTTNATAILIDATPAFPRMHDHGKPPFFGHAAVQYDPELKDM